MNYLEKDDFVCLNCKIEDVIDDLLGKQDQFKSILKDNIIEYEMFSVVDALEEAFRSLKKAKIDLQILNGNDVFRTCDGIDIMPPIEHVEH